MKTSIFPIPDFNPLYEAVKAYVAANQKQDGFIFTGDKSKDGIYALMYSQEEDKALELHVKAVRVNFYGILEIFAAPYASFYSKDDMPQAYWVPVKSSDTVYFKPTILAIAENIEEYVETD